MNDKPHYAGTHWGLTLDPTYEGAGGSVWEWSTTDEEKAANPQSHGQYLIYAPASNPFWWWYVLGAIDLRVHEGFPDIPAPKKAFEEAEYEMIVMALNPEYPVPPPKGDPSKTDTPLMILQPPDQAIQIGALPGGDEDMLKFIDLVARACADGYLVPDQDHRARWAQVIGNTYEHFINPEAHGHGHSHD